MADLPGRVPSHADWCGVGYVNTFKRPAAPEDCTCGTGQVVLPLATGSGQSLLTDVDGQAETGILGRVDQLGPLGGRDADGDRLPGIDGARAPRTPLLGEGHATRIGDTGTLDKAGYSCHGNCHG